MNTSSVRLALRIGLVAVLMSFLVGYTAAQDPSLPSNSGWAQLTAGFMPDPYGVNVTAGGSLHTNLAGVNAWVSRAPDFKLYYAAGSYPMTIYVDSPSDTTLLINLPDGSWVADDDSGGNLNPLLRFAAPQSGRYDIWVGTYNGGNAPATLWITERR